MKQSNLSRLMDYAGSRRALLYLSWILSALSALIPLVPFWYIWRIIHAVLFAALVAGVFWFTGGGAAGRM